MKIGILYICTGKYVVFWKEFYNSFMKNFCNDCEKDFFVFTDSSKIEFEEKENVHKIFQENLGWPYNTLMRFSMFDSIKETLKKFDYLYFFNANMICNKKVYENEILPNLDNGKKLIVVIHPRSWK